MPLATFFVVTYVLGRHAGNGMTVRKPIALAKTLCVWTLATFFTYSPICLHNGKAHILYDLGQLRCHVIFAAMLCNTQ